VNARNHRGRTALWYAFQSKYSDSQFRTVAALLKHGAHGNSSPGCGLLHNISNHLEGYLVLGEDDDVEEDIDLTCAQDYSNSNHQLHVLLLRGTLPVLSSTKNKRVYEDVEDSECTWENNMASACLKVHQAHFRHARAIFVGARTCAQLLRTCLGGVDSPIAKALVLAYSAEERAEARKLPLTAMHRPRPPHIRVDLSHVQSEAALQAHSAKHKMELLDVDEAVQRVYRFALDLNMTKALPANERNECGLNTALWHTYLGILNEL